MSEIKYPNVYQSHVLPFKQEYEGALAKDTDYAEFFNDKGFVIRAKTDEGADLHLWSFMYQQRGPEVIVDGDLTQSLFMLTNYSDEEKQSMHDNAYINKGQNIEDYGKVGDIKIDESADEVVWSTPNRKYVCKPQVRLQTTSVVYLRGSCWRHNGYHLSQNLARVLPCWNL